MEIFMIIVLIAFFVFGVIILGFFVVGYRYGNSSYKARRVVLTKNEREFYEILKNIIDRKYELFVKIRLADVVYPGLSKIKWNKYFYQITNKHVDFLLCERETIRPLLIIELDDRSHLKPERMKRDRFVNKVCRDSGIEILRIKVQREYDSKSLQKKIGDMIREE